MTLRSYGDALADLSTAMLEVHEQTCEIGAAHRWEACTSTPTIFGVADALDAAPDGADPVALVMHDRECTQSACVPDDEGFGAGLGARLTHARESWGEQAAAVLRWVAEQKEAPLPPVASLRGDLMVLCKCGHVRRGHSVDGRRCYSTPCTCAVAGGFRKAVR